MIERYVNFKWGLSGEPQTMEVRDGRVLTRDIACSESSVVKAGDLDLGGCFVLPSFIDAHCHILPTGLDLNKLHLDSVTSREECLQMVADEHRRQPDGWLEAVHYNQTTFSDGVHLTRDDLDRVSSIRPIIAIHVNGHACIANSAALAAAGVDDSTPDPPGGSYRRDAGGRMDGVLLERAYEHVAGSAPMRSIEEMTDAIVAAGQEMSKVGIACASDMATGVFDLESELEAYTMAAKRGCPIHMRLYLQWSQVFGKRAVPGEKLAQLVADLEATGTSRVAGIKIFADGGISSATAAIYGSFVTTEGRPKVDPLTGIQTDGQLIYKPERLNNMVQTAHDAGFQVSVHSIGDYSTDLVMDALEKTGDAARHRIEHAMIMSDRQIERMSRIGCFCATQPEFLMRLGEAYRRQLGPDRASNLIRSRSMIDGGIRVSFNSDRPIVSGDPWDGIRTAENRPAGFDPAENCTRLEAILAYTVEAASITGDLSEMGTLHPGSFAHFQTYDDDPLKVRCPKLKAN